MSLFMDYIGAAYASLSDAWSVITTVVILTLAIGVFIALLSLLARGDEQVRGI